MGLAPGAIRVTISGQLVTLLSLQHAGTDVPLFNDAALTDQVAFPVTLSADTTYYVDGGWRVPLTLAANTQHGDALPSVELSITQHGQALAQFVPDDTRSADVTSRTKLLVLNAGDPVPGGTPSGTVILRRP